jgi:hypothetical protein
MGSTLFASGQISEGIGGFQKAFLGIQKAALALLSANNIFKAEKPPAIKVHSILSLRVIRTLSLKLTQGVISYTYSRSFQLDLMDGEIDNDSMILLCSATVLFNLALAYHQQGLQGKGTHLRKALRIYQICRRVLARAPGSRGHASLIRCIDTIVALSNETNCH